MKPLRINLNGGPGLGKSTLAARLFSRLKRDGHKIELVQEYVKTRAWQGTVNKQFDRVYFLAKQMKRELDLLEAGVSIITCSSLYTCAAYTKTYFPQLLEPFLSIVRSFEAAWPSVNFILVRPAPEKMTYKSEGRYETLDEAKKIDEEIETIVEQEDEWYYHVDPIQHCDFIYDICKANLR